MTTPPAFVVGDNIVVLPPNQSSVSWNFTSLRSEEGGSRAKVDNKSRILCRRARTECPWTKIGAVFGQRRAPSILHQSLFLSEWATSRKEQLLESLPMPS